MANPLILSTRRSELLVQLGRHKRRQDRKDEAEVVITQAIKILRHHLPQMLEDPPCTDQFESKWPAIDAQLRHDLKTLPSYRFAYSVICQKIEEGNRQGIWHIRTPPPYLTLRRPHPFRSEQWHQATITMANAVQSWRPQLSESTQDPDRLFARLLVCGILYGGLNRPPLWLALGQALLAIQPLSGNKELAWITLTLAPGELPSNSYCRHGAYYSGAEHNEGIAAGPSAITQVNYMPDPISLGVLRQFLKHRPATWCPPTRQTEYLALLERELGGKISQRALCRGAIGLTEHLPGVELPQALLEYAVGRTQGASLPLEYWHRLLEPRLFPAEQDSYKIFRPPGSNMARPATGAILFTHKPYLLDELRAIVPRDKDSSRGPSAIIADLEALTQNNPLTLSEQVLVGWLLSLLQSRRLRPSTAHIYLNAIGKEWLSITVQLPLASYDSIDFTELYYSILNRQSSQKQRNYMAARFQDMHAFAVQAFDIAPLHERLASGEKSIPHVSAAVVDEPLFAGLLAQIDCFKDADHALRRMLKCFLIMAYRTGLRPGELAKLRLMDVEPSPIGWLFVRNNRHGHNKTAAALRKVPLYPMLTSVESEIVGRYVGDRRMSANGQNELLFHAAENTNELLDIQQIALMVRTVLYQLSGGLYYRLYHLRHSCLSRMQLLLHDNLVSLPHFVQQALLPYSTAEREKIVHLVAGKNRQRDGYMALAVMAGHSSPDTTFSNYLHFSDLLLGCHLACNHTSLSRQESRSLFGLSANKHRKLENEQEKQPALTAAKLLPYFLARLGAYQAKPLRQRRQAIQAKTRADADRASHYVQSEAILKHFEKASKEWNGWDDWSQLAQRKREIVSQFGLSEELVVSWEDSAIALCGLITQKVRSRLMPRNRQFRLLPAELGTTAEKHALADALKICQTMRHKPKQMAELRWTIRYCLTHLNSSHAGIKFSDPKTFRRFMAFVSRLFPWSQWQLVLHVSQDKPAKRWHLHPELTIKRNKLRKAQQFPQGYAFLYLRHPKEELRQADHSSPLLRYLFHRLAIILFKAHDIHRWQIGDSKDLQRVAALVDTEPMTYEALKKINEMSNYMTRYEISLCGPLQQEALLKADEDLYSDFMEDDYEENRLRAAEWTCSSEES